MMSMKDVPGGRDLQAPQVKNLQEARSLAHYDTWYDILQQCIGIIQEQVDHT